jgi:hypothetical protein
MLVHHLIPASRLLRYLTGLALLAAFAAPLLAARAPDPHTRIPLEPLGLQHLPPQLVTAGSSLLTLHYVDEHHLLVTFAVRRLMKRIPEDAPEDFDRTVDAVLLDLPSAKVLARTSWRLHDTGRYLWSLGRGRFLLRIHDRLTTFAPVANLPTGEPFHESPLLDTTRRVAVVLFSPDASLLTLETTAARPAKPDTVASPNPPAAPLRRPGTLIPRTGPPPSGADSESPTPTRVPFQINFYRLSVPATATEGVHVIAAGVIGSARPVAIPADASGFINVVDEGQGHWAFNFNTYAGKTEELSPFDSNCQPFPELVSRSEFVAFGCRNGQDPQVFAGFNFRGEEMWEQILPGSYISPSLAFSPVADRFALSRVLTTGTLPAVGEPIPDQITAQNVTVYQTDNGRQIFTINCTPVSRSGENFTLSPDGMDVAVVRDATVEIYRLPELSSKDRAGLKKAESLTPLLGEGPVRIYLPLSATASHLAAIAAAQPAGKTARQAASQISTESPAQPDAQPPVADPGPASATPSVAIAPSSSTPPSSTPPSSTPPSSTPPSSTPPSSTPSAGTPSTTAIAPSTQTSTDLQSDANASGDSNQPRRKPPTLYNPPNTPPQ